jgi:FkbM family methyltransferase
LNHLKVVGITPATVLDVGVAEGTPELYRAYPNAEYLLVEPLIEYQEFLNQLLSRHIHGSHIIAAAGSTPGTARISVRGQASSVLTEVDASDATLSWRDVRVVTLDQVCASRELRPPYLLKVDVQGAELDVLGGATTILSDCGVVILEVSLLQALNGGPSFADVIRWMDVKGFSAYDIFGGAFRPFDHTLAQIDIVFVPTGGWLHRYQGWRPRREPTQ